MKKFTFLFLALLLTACSSTRSKGRSYTYEDFEKIWSPQSGFIRVANEAYYYALLKGPSDAYARLYKFDAIRKTLTLEFDAGSPIAFFQTDPQHKTFYLGKDNGGDENFQIYEYFPKDKKIQKIFGNTGFMAYPVEISEDGQRIYLNSNHENKAIFSLYVYNKQNLKVTQLSKDISIANVTINPNEKSAIIAKNISNTENKLFELNFKTKKHRAIKLPSKNSYSVAAYHPKQKNTVLLNTNYNFDRDYCALLDLKTLKITPLYQTASKDIYCSYSFFEHLSTVTESKNALTKLRVFDGFFKKEFKLPEAIKNKNLVAQSLYPYEGRKWTFVARSSRTPGTLYEYSLQDAELDKLLDLNAGPIREEDFADSFNFTYKSFDSKPIHAVFFAKENWVKSKKKHPVILWPHGGPDYLTEHDYSSRFQYWVNRGYIVLGPNFRGSTGYGKAFEKLNDKDWGGGHIKDLIWAKKKFSELPFVDPKNFFIVGASFGGYSVLSTITQYPTEFKAAEATVAIGNLFTFMKSIPPDPAWQGEFLTEIGDPKKDKKLYRERSPFFHAQNIKIPLKINQAENDVRTVLGEMNSFVAKLHKLKIPVDYTIYKNEGHRFQNKENIKKLTIGTVDFLDKYRK
ncbi:MAG: prolyl oligopeptidase family serine peptidase [Bdellovibrionota bacterium]